MPPPPPEGSQWPPRWVLQYGRQSEGRRTFRQILADAVRELAETGYSSPEAIEAWTQRLRNAAEAELGPDSYVDQQVREALGSVFRKWVDQRKIAQRVDDIRRFGIEIIRPQLRAELDRRILAAADLIKLHRREAVERTLQRFRGWSTSIPPGGDGSIDKREVRSEIGKSVAQFRYERRRVDTDQASKLVANITHIAAVDGGAIAGIWHDHGEHDRNYHARKEHMARSGKLFVRRDGWAYQQGLITGGDGFMEDIEMVGQLPFCRCFYTYITSPRRLPDQMLTRAGQEWVARGRMEMAA